MTNEEIFARICELIREVDRKGLELKPETTFQQDLELDSLTVMDFVADLEDDFDIVIPINLLPDLETIQHVADAVEKILAEDA